MKPKNDSFPSQGRLFNLAKKIGMGWDGLRVAPNYIEFNPLSEKRKETNAKLQYFSMKPINEKQLGC